MVKKLVMFILLFFPVQLCFAEETIELEKIVITPYKTAVSASLNSSSTDVILVEELSDKGVFTLGEAINSLPSLYLKSSGMQGGDTSVFIRGANSAHTQVLLDGIKLYDPQSISGYFYAYNYMSLDNLKRIEITKGPYSTLYGSASIGGTVNLITKKGQGKPTFSYLQEFGSYQTAREELSSQGEINKLAYSFSVSRTDIDHSYAGKYKDGNQEADPYHNLSSLVRLDYALTDDIEIGLLADYTYAKYEYDGWGGTDDDDNYAYFYQGVGGVNLKHQLSDCFSHKAILGYTRTYRKGWESSTSDNWYEGKSYQAKWQGDWQVFDQYKLLFGFDYLREKGEDFSYSTRNPSRTANTKGYYIENIFVPINNLFLSASFRCEDHSSFKTHNVFSLSGSYTFEPTASKIKASFGEGFKAPSLYQLYNGTYGNPNLDPEESESYEVGIEQDIGSNLTINLTYFHTHIKNLLDTVGTWPSIEYQNVGKARIYGIENSLKYALDDLSSLSVSYTHMDTENKSDSSELLYRPNNKITAEFKKEIDKLKFYLSVSYVGDRIASSTVKLKPYVLGNIGASYQINSSLTTFLRLENILDYDYEVNDGYQTPKFSWYLGAKYTF